MILILWFNPSVGCHILIFLQAIPERYSKYNLAKIDEFFALGRGLQKPDEGIDVPSLVC